MNFNLKINDGEKVIELGGGAHPFFRPNVDVRICMDAEGKATVDFAADFNNPLPIANDEWDVVFTRYAIEHISWRNIRSFILEVARIIKPGGRAIVITANTEAQIEWIQNHPDGWDGHGPFDSCSSIIFGDQDYPDNSHRCYMNLRFMADLLDKAGFRKIIVQPFGDRLTDLIAEAWKS